MEKISISPPQLLLVLFALIVGTPLFGDMFMKNTNFILFQLVTASNYMAKINWAAIIKGLFVVVMLIIFFAVVFTKRKSASNAEQKS